MPDKNPALAVRRLSELVRRVYSSSDTEELLEEIVTCVVEVLGYGVAAIARLEGETLVMTNVAGPQEVRAQILGRRTPAHQILDEFRQADRWGILRFVPAGRMSDDRLQAAWIPDVEPVESPDAWHPEDALYAPLYSSDGELLGNMAVDLPPGGVVPGTADRELLEMFVVQAGLALTAARERDRLTERVRLEEMLKQLAKAASGRNLATGLERAVAAVSRGLEARQVWVRCFPERARGREHVAGTPHPADLADDVVTLRQELVDHDVADPVVIGVEDRSSEQLPVSLDSLRGALKLVDAVQGVVCPIIGGGDLVGYLLLAFAPSRPRLTEGELDAVGEVGRELGRMVQQTRVFDTEQRLVEELRELARYRSELIATISHELKTPLTAILGHAELMQERQPEEVSLQAIIRNTARLNMLVDNLLTYSRVQGRLDAVQRAVDLDAVCRASVEMLDLRARQGEVALGYAPPPQRVVVFGDPDELGRVVDNLVDNAVKYTRAGGTVEVGLHAADDHVVVEVTDTGLGITEYDQGRLFSAFHRSTDPNALCIPGTGLGLPIAQRIADAHGGRIEVSSRHGQGSTFRFVLPLRRS